MKKALSLILALSFLTLPFLTSCGKDTTKGPEGKPSVPNVPSTEESTPDNSDSAPVVNPSVPVGSESERPSSSEEDNNKNTLTLEQLKILLQHLKDNQTSDKPIDKEEQQKIEDQIKEAIEANKDPISNKDVYNVLLIGYDYKTEGGPKNSDTMIMISINFKMKTFTMTSFMRDSYVQIPGVGNNRLNVAFAVGGYPLLKTTIQNNFGISIDNYVALTFRTFIEFYDTLGGMDITLTAKEAQLINERSAYYYNCYTDENYPINTTPVKEGLNHLDGVQLLVHARNRSTGDADFGRTERQRKLIGDTVKKMASMSVDELYELMDLMLPQVTTDIPANECTSLLMKMIARNVFSYKQQSMRIPDSGTWKEKIVVIGKTNQQVLALDFAENTKRFKKLVYGIES